MEGSTGSATVYSPDGATLAAGLDDGTVALRDVASGRVRAVLQGHRHRVGSLAFAPDGRLLAGGGGDGSVHIWDMSKGLKGGRLDFRHSGKVTSLRFSPDGKALASGGGDATVRLWDVATDRQVIMRGHESEVSGVAFSPDGATLASAGHDGTIRLWDAAGGRERAVVRGHTYRVNKTRAETRVIDGEAVTSYIALPGEFEDIPIPIYSLAYSPDGRTLATGGRADSGEGEVSLRDATTGEERMAFRPAGRPSTGEDVNALAFSPDGRLLALAGYGTVRISDAFTGRVLASLKAGGYSPIHDVAFSPDGKTMTYSSDQAVLSWDVEAVLKSGTE
jgi:WD40 repeat protein